MSRELFEKLHPVPDCVEWAEDGYYLIPGWVGAINIQRYNSLWQGFQSGHAAGLEDALKACEVYTYADVAANAIRAMKEPK